MSRRLKGISRKAGLPPGTMVHVGHHARGGAAGLRLISYGPDEMETLDEASVADAVAWRGRRPVVWVKVTGISDLAVVEETGKAFGLHPLVLEDIVNTHQRAKMEDYDQYIFLVLKLPRAGHSNGEPAIDQISLVLGPDYVLTFEERDSALLEPVIQRLRSCRGRIRGQGPDYLVYALADMIVDQYYVVLEDLGERIEAIEDELVGNPRQDVLGNVHALKNELLFLRRAIWPVREVIGALERGGSALMKESTAIYFRDVYDHAVQVMDTVETYRDIASGMLDIYLSSVSNRLGEVMKLLTIISTIFIPLTFIAGFYGMNFEYIPGLRDPLGYLAILTLMGVIALAMLRYFRRRQWL